MTHETEGNITLARRYFQHPLWKQSRRFSRAEAWLDLLYSAAWRNHAITVGQVRITLRRGEVPHSVRTLAERWSWGVASVKRFLDYLDAEHMTERRAERGVHLLVIKKYDTYQLAPVDSGTPTGTPSGTEQLTEHLPERAAEQETESQCAETKETCDTDEKSTGTPSGTQTGTPSGTNRIPGYRIPTTPQTPQENPAASGAPNHGWSVGGEGSPSGQDRAESDSVDERVPARSGQAPAGNDGAARKMNVSQPASGANMSTGTAGAAFPALADRGITPAQVEKLLAGKNGSAALWLAALADAAADPAVRLPLRVVESRVRAGSVNPQTVAKARAALGETGAPRGKLFSGTCPACGAEVRRREQTSMNENSFACSCGEHVDCYTEQYWKIEAKVKK